MMREEPVPAGPPEAQPQADQRGSYRQIFKATSIIGGAQIASIAIGVARTKGLALLLGPAGIGLLGHLTALLTAASTVAQMGLGAAGTRQISQAHASADRAEIALARRGLILLSLVLAAFGGGAVWLLSEPLARYGLGNGALQGAVAWLALGVALSVAALAQASLIQGMRRMWDLAVLQIGGALMLALIGLPLVWRFGEAAVPFYVVLTPLTAFVLGHVLVARMEPLPKVAASWRALAAQGRLYLGFGLPIMGAAVIGTAITLGIQTHIKDRLGIEALGYFVASNTIAMHYAGLVLTAMAGDYFPRLSGVIGDAEAARRLVNQQTEVALLLAGPLILGLFALAPLVVDLLYSPAFAPAAEVLRWQAAGTLLKVLSWPMGFILLALGAGRTFFVTETATLFVMAGATALAIDQFGLVGAGIGYAAAYVFYLPLMLLTAAPRIGLVWSREVLGIVALLGAGLAALLWPLAAPSLWSKAMGTGLAALAGIIMAIRAARALGLPARLSRAFGARP